ncbi:MAG: hypothetical protein ACI3ZQ_00045 [Candidatus Cryptobacteroides sp.]
MNMDIFGDETFNKYLYTVRNHNYQFTMKLSIVCKYVVAILLINTSCSTYRTELEDVESYINERPDSALAFLQSIDVSSVKGKADKNHYYLLLAQAKDKCFIDETDDSLMLSVVDYYSKRNDFGKLFKAYYYLGRIQQNDHRYMDAMYSYTEAEQLLNHIEDDYAKGLLYAQLGALYHSSLDFLKALNSFEIAYDFYDKAEKIAHKNYINLDIGNAYYKLNRFDQAEKSLSGVLSWALDNEYYLLCQDVAELLCLVYEADDDIEALRNLLNHKACCMQNEETLIINRAKAYVSALSGNYHEADRLIESSWRLIQNPVDSCMLYHMGYIVNKMKGDYMESLKMHETLFALQDSLVHDALQKPLQSVQNDYFKTKASYNEQLLKSSKYRLYLAIIIAICAIISLMLLYRRRIESKETKISAYIDLADELRTSLEVAQNKLDAASSEKDYQNVLLKEMSSQIAVLFSKQYEMLDKLSNTYYETHGSHRDKEAIYQQVKGEIENFSTNKKYLIQLEKIVNEYKGNVMAILRGEMKELKEMDFRFLCFLFAGFSAKAISAFTGDSTANIYMKNNSSLIISRP